MERARSLSRLFRRRFEHKDMCHARSKTTITATASYPPVTSRTGGSEGGKVEAAKGEGDGRGELAAGDEGEGEAFEVHDKDARQSFNDQSLLCALAAAASLARRPLIPVKDLPSWVR